MNPPALRSWAAIGLAAVSLGSGAQPVGQTGLPAQPTQAAQDERVCWLELTEHRSGRPLARLPIGGDRPVFEIHFVHSVHGTPVLNRYEWRPGPQGWRAHLIEERFEGEGYGLASAPAAGETLTRVASAGGGAWKLSLDRVVDPLVVRALSAQQMRLALDDHPGVYLASLTSGAVHLQLERCDAR